MLFCRSQRLIFVHVYKTGGTSVAHALRSNLGSFERCFHGLGYHIDRHGRLPVPCWKFLNSPPHLTALEIRRLMPEKVFARCFKFAFVRNPWSLQLSLFRYVRNSPDHPQHDIVSRFSGFGGYIDWLSSYPNGSHRQQCHFLLDEEGRLMMDFVGRFETLAADFSRIAGRLGIPATLLHLNASHADPDYRKFYTPRTRDLVAELHRMDIGRFGYEF